MFVRPGVQVKPIKGNPYMTHRNLDEQWPNVAFKNRRADPKIGRCLGRTK
jgi:hypothetical protein